MTESWWRLDATEQARLVGCGEVTASELMEATLSRIEALNPRVNAVVGLDAERALSRAKRPQRGPFGGVPFLAKDLLPMPGLLSTSGSRIFAGHVPDEHVPYTRRVEGSGLICVGKSTTSEFGLLGSTETALHGVTRNPWDLDHSAGGSSGGAAAAVACGMVPFAHASDGGGSIRIPAALCGLFGFKPSRGVAVPAVEIPGGMASLNIEHCVSRSVRDSARFLAVTEDRGRPGGAIGVVAPGGLRRLRIGVYTRTLMGHATTEVGRAAVEEAARCCEALGHHVEEIEAPPAQGEEITRAFFMTASAVIAGMAQMMSGVMGRRLGGGDLEPFTRALIEWYEAQPEGALAQASRDLEAVGEVMRGYLNGWDVTLCPTVGVETPPLGFLAPGLPMETILRRTERLAGYTPAHNIAGAPAMSVPLFWSDEGLPVGVHFAAPVGADATLLKLAYELEEARPWRGRWPELCAS